MIGVPILTRVAWLTYKRSRHCRWELRRQITWASTVWKRCDLPLCLYLLGRHLGAKHAGTCRNWTSQHRL